MQFEGAIHPEQEGTAALGLWLTGQKWPAGRHSSLGTVANGAEVASTLFTWFWTRNMDKGQVKVRPATFRLISSSLLPSKDSSTTSPNKAPRRTSTKTQEPLEQVFHPSLDLTHSSVSLLRGNISLQGRRCCETPNLVRHGREKLLFCQKIYREMSVWPIYIHLPTRHGKTSIVQNPKNLASPRSPCCWFQH